MADIKGDKTKQPPECEPKWIPFSTDNPHDPMRDSFNAKGRWTRCPNLKETSRPSDMEGETWGCEVCGEHYRLYYDDMR